MVSLPQTPRLMMRPHRPDDVDFMIALNADPEVVRYTGDVAFTERSEAEAVVASLEQQYRERRLGRFVVLDRHTGERLGWCGLRWFEQEGGADLGFRFFRAVWGRGYATEAGRAYLDYGAALGVPRIFANAIPSNIGSVRVLEKLGFRRTGTFDADGFERFELS